MDRLATRSSRTPQPCPPSVSRRCRGNPTSATEEEAEPREVPPAIVATGLTLTTKRGPIFQDVALTVPPATIAAVVGPSGTGRTSLLLALTGRMKQLSGNLAVAGHSLADEPAAVRAFTSVARIGHEIEPEPSLTIAESVRERCLLEKVPFTAGRERFASACEVIGLELPPNLLVGDLGGDDATLLALALAAIPVTAVIVLDDIDRGVDGVTQYRLLDAVSRLAETGPAIVFTTTDRLRVAGVPVIVDMPLLSVQPVPVAPPAELVLEDAELSRRELSEAAAWRRELERGRTDESIDADPDAGDLRAGDEVQGPVEAWYPQGPPEASGSGQPLQYDPLSPQPPSQDPPPDDGATTVITPEDRR